MPLQRRLPKRGFTNIFKKVWIEVKLAELARRFDENDQITPELLVERRLIKKSHLDRFAGVVILGGGEVTKKLNISAHRFTKGVKEKIEAAGGTATLLAVSKESGATE